MVLNVFTIPFARIERPKFFFQLADLFLKKKKNLNQQVCKNQT